MLNGVDELQAERGVNTLVLRFLIAEIASLKNDDAIEPLTDRLSRKLEHTLSEIQDSAEYRREMHDYMRGYLADLLKAPICQPA